jgi:hypothetical protein
MGYGVFAPETEQFTVGEWSYRAEWFQFISYFSARRLVGEYGLVSEWSCQSCQYRPKSSGNHYNNIAGSASDVRKAGFSRIFSLGV